VNNMNEDIEFKKKTIRNELEKLNDEIFSISTCYICDIYRDSRKQSDNLENEIKVLTAVIKTITDKNTIDRLDASIKSKLAGMQDVELVVEMHRDHYMQHQHDIDKLVSIRSILLSLINIQTEIQTHIYIYA